MNSLLTEYDEEKTLAAIREVAFKEGREKGLSIVICAFIQDYLEDGKTKEEIIVKLIKRFSLSREEAELYYEQITESKQA